MQKNFTQDDVLLYIYNEIEPQDIPLIEKAIKENELLQNFYLETKQTLLALNEIKETPSDTTIHILNEETRSNSLEIH